MFCNSSAGCAGFFRSIGGSLVLISTSRYGAGISPDSISYISAARSLVHGGGFTITGGTPVVAWPPLYPALLALFGWVFNLDPMKTANVLNAFLYGFIIYAGGVLSLRYLSSTPVLAILGVVLILASIPLFNTAVMVWSEPLFILLVLLSIISSQYYLRKRDTISLLALAILVSLACLTRYIGLMLVLWGIALISFHAGANKRKKLVHALSFSLVTIAPLAAWLSRNYALSGTLFGLRAPVVNTLDKNLSFVFNRFLVWYIPDKIADHRAWLILIGLCAGLLAGVSLINGVSKKKLRHLLLDPMLSFTLIYLTVLVVLATVTATDGIGDRLLSPMYVPLTLLLLTSCYTIMKRITERRRGSYWHFYGNVLFTAFILIWLLYPLDHNVLVEAKQVSNGVGYSSQLWRNSELMGYLIKNQEAVQQYAVYSNHPDAIDILAGLASEMSPIKTRFNSPEMVNVATNLVGTWPPEDNARLIWFDRHEHAFLYSLEEIKQIADLELITAFTDGVIYKVERK